MERADRQSVSREEFDAFAKEVTDAICLLKTQLGTRKEVEVAFYRCDEEGCRYTTQIPNLRRSQPHNLGYVPTQFNQLLEKAKDLASRHLR